jgi:ribosomal-protein-alanine N-acetyltransferase
MAVHVNTSIIRTASPADHHQLASLIHFETYVHRHLDWRGPLDWLGSRPYLLLERSGRLAAALACPPDPPEIAWVRLFAIASFVDEQDAWQRLWPAAVEQLLGQPEVASLAAIPLQGWFNNLLADSGFAHVSNVVMLLWDGGPPHPASLPEGVNIRPMNFDDLPGVQAVDQSAFDPLWRNSLSSLEQAYRQAALATVAENGGEILGYQISTATPLGGHLARLAVAPEMQGQGIGYQLACDLLSQFHHRGASQVTVNTQNNNAASLALYHRLGFIPTGESYPVYVSDLP